MRQIKFRAWNKEKQYMIQNAIIDFGGRIFDVQCEPKHEELTDKVELMQYTEVRDIKEKEIYEGDIFRFVYSFDPNPRREWNSIVIFKNSCFGWKPLYPSLRHEDDQGFHSFLSEDDGEVPTNIEIIGNKFENPELLKLND